MFDQILDLVGQPPGSLVYHFIILFAVEAALAISFGQWMRERDNKTARLTIAIVGVFAARTLVLIASLLAWQGYLPRNVLLPPIERTVDTLTVLGLAWAFVTMDDPSILQRNFAPDLGAAVALGMMLAGFVGTYYYWYFSAASGQLFNGSWLDILWATFQIVFSAAGLIWMLIRGRYVYDPFLKGIMLILLGGAAGVHLVRPGLGDVASAMRVGQIVVMPMLAAIAYRHVVEQLLHWDEFEPAPASQPPMMVAQPIAPAPPPPIDIAPPPPESLEETRQIQVPPEEEEKPKTTSELPMLEVVEAIGGLLGSLEQAEVTREAARTIATALRADIAVLAIVDEGTQQAAILGAYDNIAQTYLPRAVLDLADHPSIVNTLGRLRQMRLTTNRNLRELRDLYGQLMISHEGPAYLQPLVNGEERIGVLIVGSPYSERQLSNEERNLLDRLGPLVTAAMLNAQDYHRMRMETEQVMVEEGARLASLSDELTATTSELNDARRQMEEMKSYIRDLHRQVESFPQQQEAARQRIETLQKELKRFKPTEVERADGPDGSDGPDGPDGSDGPDGPDGSDGPKRVTLIDAGDAVDASELREAYEELKARFEELEPDAIAAQQLRDENERLRLERALQQRLSTDKLGEMEQERQQLQQEIGKLEKLQQENEELREQLQATEKYAEEIEALKEELNDHKTALTSRSHVEQIRFEQRLDEAQHAAQTEIASLRTRLAQASISQQEVAFLQEQLGLKSKEVITLQTKLTEVEAVASALREQIDEGPVSSRKLTALQDRVAEQTSIIATLRSELEEAQLTASLDTETLEQQQALDESDREAMAHLEAQLAERAALVEVLQAQLSEKTRAIVELKAQMEEVETSMRSVESQLTHKTDEVAALQDSLAETRSETQGRMEALRVEVDKGTRDASEMDQAYVENLEAQLAEKSAAIQTLEAQLSTARASMESLEAKLAETNQAVTEVISDARRVDSHDEVIASIAQELRTPMSSIMGYTELLLRESVGILGTLQRKFLQRVKANTERMGSLLDDLVQITALDTGQYQFEPEPVDAIRAVEEAVMNQANQYREKGLTLRLALPQSLPPINADRDAFIQLMGHLLSNAALASPIESEVQLTVTSRREVLEEAGDPKDCLYITVEDSGGGVAEDDYERVFSRKYRADNPLIEGLGDTGVSLSLAKTLIDEHGGRIWLESELGIGTTFHVLLPFETAQEEV